MHVCDTWSFSAISRVVLWRSESIIALIRSSSISIEIRNYLVANPIYIFLKKRLVRLEVEWKDPRDGYVCRGNSRGTVREALVVVSMLAISPVACHSASIDRFSLSVLAFSPSSSILYLLVTNGFLLRPSSSHALLPFARTLACPLDSLIWYTRAALTSKRSIFVQQCNYKFHHTPYHIPCNCNGSPTFRECGNALINLYIQMYISFFLSFTYVLAYPIVGRCIGMSRYTNRRCLRFFLIFV